MITTHTKSVRSIFLRSQILISLAVLSIVTAILTILLLSLANFIDHQRILELSQSIESQTRIAKNTRYLQHAITEIVRNKQAKEIVVYSQHNNKITAAANLVTINNTNSLLVTDQEVRKQLKKSLSEGVFGIHIINSENHRVTILPLAPPIRNITGNSVSHGPKWPTPFWHRKAEQVEFSPANLWTHVQAIFDPKHTHNFQIPRGHYAGAIVMETSRDWVTVLVLRGVAVISILLAISIAIVVMVLSGVLRKTILQPVRQYIDVISARRAGDYKARIPLSNTQEFNELAHQWNSLLDYRDVAQGQNMVLSTLLEHVPVGIDVTDVESHIEYANPSFLHMTGYSLAEVIGKTPDFLLALNKMDHTVRGDSLVAIANGETWTGEVIYQRKDGTDLICNTTFVPLLGRDGKLERLISVRHDITDLKNDERSLIAAKINAETADKSKSEFLTNMSHELRTPLNAIIGFSEMMAAQKLGPIGNDEYVEFSQLIATSSRTLLSSINLILDLSRLDSQQIQLNETSFCIAELLHKLIEIKTPAAQSLGIEIKRNLSCKHDIRADQRMLRQTLENLLCNAIRYNPEGGTVMVTVKEANDQVIVTIADTGIGISQEDLPKVTTPFYRVDSALSRMKDGAGLGLSLVKKFTDEQKIGFDIASKPAHGTTVTLTFPIAEPETHLAPPAPFDVNKDQVAATNG